MTGRPKGTAAACLTLHLPLMGNAAARRHKLRVWIKVQ
jgi:hypothetical protein